MGKPTNEKLLPYVPAIAFLPGKDGGPPLPCPEVLTEEEAIRYCRLDEVNISNPGDTLARYRKEGKLRGTQIGKAVRYLRVELDRFLTLQTEQNPR